MTDSPETTGAPEDTVRAFLDHLAARDLDAAQALLADDVEWRNSGLPVMRGDRVRETLRDLVGRGLTLEVRFHHVATDGDVVLTDRTDVIGVAGWKTEFRVRGSFAVRDGKIAVWDDSFSWLEVAGSGLSGVASMGLDLLRRSR